MACATRQSYLDFTVRSNFDVVVAVVHAMLEIVLGAARFCRLSIRGDDGA